MSGCPDSECQKNVHGLRVTLFGENGRHGVVGAEAEKEIEHEKGNSNIELAVLGRLVQQAGRRYHLAASTATLGRDL